MSLRQAEFLINFAEFLKLLHIKFNKTKKMQFEKGHIYHIYNQGNNRQNIFFERDNYLFFLKKLKKYILPYGDILAWCLMPNHFHLMVLVNEMEVDIASDRLGVSQRQAESDSEPNSASKGESKSKPKLRNFNTSIGIMLMAYTKAINKQEGRSGKLFREQTKAECIDCLNNLSPSFITEDGISKINITHPQKQYPQICFNYIHNNPVKAKMVAIAEKYEFSSAMDYAGIRDGKLINKTIANKFIDL